MDSMWVAMDEQPTYVQAYPFMMVRIWVDGKPPVLQPNGWWLRGSEEGHIMGPIGERLGLSPGQCIEFRKVGDEE